MNDPLPFAGTTHLEVRGLTKSFYGVRAIDSVDFVLEGGEIHGLLGENGAGKSTLCSVLSGLYRPDSGSVILDGKRVQFRSPQDSAKAGIGMVYQHFRLVDGFTVAQNVVLGLRKDQRPKSMRQVNALVAELAEEYGLAVDPTAFIWQLSVGEQQRVEILKQLFRGARILILDEPTAVLAPQETDGLFEAVSRMVDRGHGVVLVSHKMAETMAYTNRISVLSRGRNAGTVATADTTPEEVAKLMFGDAGAAERSSFGLAYDPGDPVLSISDLSVVGDNGQQAVDGATFEVCRGQVVGVAGVAGNGQRELQEAIAGLRPVAAGTITLDGTDCTRSGPKETMQAGLAYVPEDRLGVGLAPGLPLEHNIALRNYDRLPHSRRGVLSDSAIAGTTGRLVEEFDIRGNRAGMRVSLMSGGNLQKAILARELSEVYEVLLAAAPTRGLDMAAAEAVRSHLVGERDARRGVLVFSEDLDEVMQLSDVVLVMFKGRIVGRFSGDDLDIDRIGLLMTGSESGGDPDTDSRPRQTNTANSDDRSGETQSPGAQDSEGKAVTT
ncbi:MAG: ABC transporter ATP-binding protein [Actinomycetota bacterium]